MTSLTALPSSLPSTPSKPQSRLNESKRVDMIRTHRAFQRQLALKFGLNYSSVINHDPMRPLEPLALDGLRSILLSEMGSVDKVWKGRVLSLTVTSAALCATPSIHLVAEDDEGNSERIAICNFPSDETEALIHKRFVIGCKLSIINPYFRIALDGNTNIRVDDYKSIVLHPMTENEKKVCSFCLQTPATKVCSQCRSATYCSKACQQLDWTLYEHKSSCKVLAKLSAAGNK